MRLEQLKTKTGELTEADLQAVLAERNACQASGDRLGFARSLMVLQHVVKWVRSDTDEPPFVRAHVLAQEALQVFRQEGDVEGLIDSLCAAARFSGPEESAAMLDEALALSEEGGDRRKLAGVLASMARSVALRDRESGASLHRRALAIYEELGDRGGMATCYFSLAIGDGADRDKRTSALRATELYKELGRPSDAARSLLLAVMQGASCVSLGEQKREALEALACAQTAGRRSLEQAAYSSLARICAGLGEADEAAQYQRWHDQIEAADGMTQKERERQQRKEAKGFAALAKSMGATEAAKMFGKQAKRKKT